MDHSYKYELHIHDSRCSACSRSTMEEQLKKAKQLGYTGLVLSNHFYRGNTAVDRSLPWKEFVDVYAQDYFAAKKYGEFIGLDVLFGVEEGVGDGKEVLLYGLEPEVLANEDRMPHMDISTLSTFVRENGGIFAAAHPFRQRWYIPDPLTEPNAEYFDAIETFNAGNTDEDNEKALFFARCHRKLCLSGGDAHLPEHLGNTAVAFSVRPQSNREFAELLKNGNYKLYNQDKIYSSYGEREL